MSKELQFFYSWNPRLQKVEKYFGIESDADWEFDPIIRLSRVDMKYVPESVMLHLYNLMRDYENLFSRLAYNTFVNHLPDYIRFMEM